MSPSVVDPKLLKDKPKESLWVSYIKQRIRNNKNFIGIVSGSTGSGKSWSSLSIGEQADPKFDIDRVVFSGGELMRLINSGKLKKGSAIVFEEAGIGMSSKSWQSVTNKLLNFLIQTFRHRNFILIFNTPYMDFVDASTRKLFHAEFSTMSIDINEGTCRIKPRYIQYNSRNKKFYFKMLRVITARGKVPINTWSVSKPSPELIKAYEIKKRAFTDKLNIGIQKDLQKLEEEDDDKPIDTRNSPTGAQDEVLHLLEEGLDRYQIAEELFVSPQNVSKHMVSLKKKGYEIKSVRDKEKNNKVIRYIVENPEIQQKSTKVDTVSHTHDNLTRQGGESGEN